MKSFHGAFFVVLCVLIVMSAPAIVLGQAAGIGFLSQPTKLAAHDKQRDSGGDRRDQRLR